MLEEIYWGISFEELLFPQQKERYDVFRVKLVILLGKITVSKSNRREIIIFKE